LLIRASTSKRLLFMVTLMQVVLICASTFAQAEIVRVVYYPPWNISKLPLYLARDTGIFERNGLTLSWINPGSNEKLLASMKNGEGDIFVVSSNHAIQNNASSGPALTIVANSGYNYSVFLVDSAIARPEDLRGKKVGTGEPGSTPDRLTRLALRKLGLDPDREVTLVHFSDGRSADRVKALTSGQLSGILVTAEGIYDLQKSGQIKSFHILADHKRLNIYAGGGADYAMAAEFLKTRRPEAKSFLSGICEGIAVARQNRPKALEIMAKSERGRDPAALEYLYRLYTTEVIPVRPYPKFEGVELGIQMVASAVPAAHGMKTRELIDATLIEELVKEGRCN
jgi:NitT/TauT family transport system substrate-binding protein